MHELPVKVGVNLYVLERPPCTVQLQCEKDVGMGLCQYVYLCFHA